MKITIRVSIAIITVILMFSGCASKKRNKDKEPSALGKFYHNTTARYNGYFNANEIIKETYLKLEASHQDNYTEILSLYDYDNVGDAKSVADELDRAIEKVTTVALLHEPSHWVDDCYVLMGHAQYLKQDYESAEETFAYFKEEFNPTNPFGRNYKKKKVSKKALKRAKEKERKVKQKEKEQEKKVKKKEREAEKKAREDKKKQQAKDRKAEKRRRDKEKKERRKSKNKKRKGKKGKKREPKKKESTEETKEVESITPEVTKKEEVVAKKEDFQRPEEIEDDENGDEKEKKKEKIKKDKTAYSIGQMWLARTYVHRDKYSIAKYTAHKLQADESVPKSVKRELPVILADVYIRERDYEAALINLDEAIDLANEKKKKARYAYVAGQLATRLSKDKEAGEYFSKAKKWTSNFRMEFMAELNSLKNNMIGGGKSKEAVANKIDGMIKERKYADFLDQLYFTKGEILLDDNKFGMALTSFRNSIRNNIDNTPLKVETYYKLANLFYDKEDYVEAKYHFDSTLQVIEKDDARFKNTNYLSENLTDIARFIETITLQDSLLALARLDDVEIRKMAEDLVEKGIEAQKKTGVAAPTRSSNLFTGSKSVFGKTNFWAYDTQIRERHKTEFVDKWGDINLQDDWRRSDKQSLFGDEEGSEASDSTSTVDDKRSQVDKMMVQIKKQIPYSAKQKADIFAVVSVAMFELGKQYRDKIKNYAKSIETHESMLHRFASTDKKLDTYYYLYLSNLDLPNKARSDYYKNKILSEFPDTDYARVISDPAYAASLLDEEKSLESYYQETYSYFESGDYQKAYNNSKNADKKFGKANALRPKFSLLNAMALGSIKGKDIYIKALREVVATYPNTPEKARAQEIMRFLQGDTEAFDNASMEEVDDIFSEENNLKHYIAIVTYDMESDNLERAKLQVSNYNKDKHAKKKLQLSDSNLSKDKNMEIILVRKFNNKELAMAYYKDIQKAGDEFIDTKYGGYAIYAITQRNYRKMVIERSDSRYRVFFNKYYLEN